VTQKGTHRRTDIQTDGHGYIDSAVDAVQEYIYLMGSVTPPSACYALFFCTNVVDPVVLFFLLLYLNSV